jgi:hypothetical protein
MVGGKRMRAAQRITVRLVQEFIEQFLEKNKDYTSKPMPGFPEGFENADVLGIQGQFAELWRKIWKLRKSLWEGEELVGEQPREVLMDLIGHCFLAIDMIDRAVEEKRSNTPVKLNETPISCGSKCVGDSHSYVGSCLYRQEEPRP